MEKENAIVHRCVCSRECKLRRGVFVQTKYTVLVIESVPLVQIYACTNKIHRSSCYRECTISTNVCLYKQNTQFLL